MNNLIRPIQSINWHTVKSGVILLSAVAVLALLMGVFPRMQAEVPPSIGGYQFFRVVGQSMEPTFSNGSILVTYRAKPESIQPSHIITYHCPRSQVALTTHRVEQVITHPDGRIQFITRGDNNPVTDPHPVCGCELVGRVMWVITPPGHPHVLAATHGIFMIQLSIASAFLLLIRLRKQQTHRDDQRLYQ